MQAVTNVHFNLAMECWEMDLKGATIRLTGSGRRGGAPYQRTDSSMDRSIYTLQGDGNYAADPADHPGAVHYILKRTSDEVCFLIPKSEFIRSFTELDN
ncbi:MAG: hypothetical protein CMI36_02540 [Owenweeksia sp.]|nr:hypothetical protein [Owenweeksia sp.]MBF97844.1 hypothetical protein [Owenweeksia sp.]